MLTIRAMAGGAGYAQRHLEHSDYYDEHRKVQGEWQGHGAALLGLRGQVTREEFESVREGLHPETGEFLRPRHSADRVGQDGSEQSKGRSLSMFSRDMDWVFANPDTGKPFHQESLQKRPIKNAAKLAGLREGIGWHTFRHNYRSWLDETGAPMKVQQELMRHASIQTTMNVYGRAMAETKRRANSQVVGLVFGPNSQKSEEADSTATTL